MEADCHQGQNARSEALARTPRRVKVEMKDKDRPYKILSLLDSSNEQVRDER